MKQRRAPGSRKRPGAEFLGIDKTTASIHEAGHAVVALKLGSPWAKLTLERDYTRDLTSEVAFRSQCGTGEIKGKLNQAARSYAGVIAEMLYGDFTVDQSDVMEYLDLEMWTPSPTDMVSIERLSPKWRRRAIEHSLNILKTHWTSVKGVAYELHENRDGLVVFGPFALDQPTWRGLL